MNADDVKLCKRTTTNATPYLIMGITMAVGGGGWNLVKERLDGMFVLAVHFFF
jgi:hypothetical protein